MLPGTGRAGTKCKLVDKIKKSSLTLGLTRCESSNSEIRTHQAFHLGKESDLDCKREVKVQKALRSELVYWCQK